MADAILLNIYREGWLLMNIAHLIDLAREAKEKNTIMTLMDSSTMECWHVYSNGYVEQRGVVEQYDCAIRREGLACMDAMKIWANRE